jgi:pimeloyl-ACP methyl ester carboxylesterase
MATVELPAGPVHYRVAGPADGRPVVFVHGFLVDGSLWSDVPDRLAAAGLRVYVPTWPIGAHTAPMNIGADLSPRGLARLVLDFCDALDLSSVVLVGNDTGGGICQLVLDLEPSRVERLVLTNCDAFDSFPPFPFDWLFRAVRRPALGRAVLAPTGISAVRAGPIGFGTLVARRLTGEETRSWVAPYLSDAGVRRDVASFAKAWTGRELSTSEAWLSRFEHPVLLCWAPDDPYFKLALAHRLRDVLPDATLVELAGARAFVPLDQPERLATEILNWL